jgi:3-oxoacyl-[acyl-carrier protein] reductase
MEHGTPSPFEGCDPRELLPDGRVVMVTGAARGIGRATASLLGTCGARLALCDRHEEELDALAASLTEVGCEVLAVAVDVRDAGATEAFVADTITRWHVDGLVNNAGGGFAARLRDVSEKGEAMLIAENFTQVTRLVRLVAPVMPTGGAIVNVTSSEAFQGAPGFAVYAAMKAALENLSRSLALELADDGIRVNTVAPDALPSRGEADARAQLLGGDLPFDPVHLPPIGRFGSPDDAAGAILFLLSALSRFVTGTTVHVDGGIHAAGGWRRRE